MAVKMSLCSVSRRSLLPGLFTLTASKESFVTATGVGPNGGNAKYSGPWTCARSIRHFYGCFHAARIHRPDPVRPFAKAISAPRSGR